MMKTNERLQRLMGRVHSATEELVFGCTPRDMIQTLDAVHEFLDELYYKGDKVAAPLLKPTQGEGQISLERAREIVKKINGEKI